MFWTRKLFVVNQKFDQWKEPSHNSHRTGETATETVNSRPSMPAKRRTVWPGQEGRTRVRRRIGTETVPAAPRRRLTWTDGPNRRSLADRENFLRCRRQKKKKTGTSTKNDLKKNIYRRCADRLSFSVSDRTYRPVGFRAFRRPELWTRIGAPLETANGVRERDNNEINLRQWNVGGGRRGGRDARPCCDTQNVRDDIVRGRQTWFVVANENRLTGPGSTTVNGVIVLIVIIIIIIILLSSRVK